MPFYNLIVKIYWPSHDAIKLLEHRRICSFQIGQLQIATLSMTGRFRADMATSGPMFVVPAAGKVPERLSLILSNQCQSSSYMNLFWQTSPKPFTLNQIWVIKILDPYCQGCGSTKVTSIFPDLVLYFKILATDVSPLDFAYYPTYM